MSNYPTMKDINRKVVITVNDNVTLARIFDDDNKVVSKGVAKCSPEDTFDFQMGAELAMKRAFESIPKKEEKWKVVDRKPKAGDYVRIKSSMFNFDVDHPVVKVHKFDGAVMVRNVDHPKAKVIYKNDPEVTDDYIWNYWLSEVEVVEPVEPTPKYRKINRPPRPGDYIRLTRVDTNVNDCFDSVGDVLKISTCVMGGLVVGVHVNDHPKLVAHFKGVENIPFGNHDKLWMYSKLFEDYELVEEVTE